MSGINIDELEAAIGNINKHMPGDGNVKPTELQSGPSDVPPVEEKHVPVEKEDDLSRLPKPTITKAPPRPSQSYGMGGSPKPQNNGGFELDDDGEEYMGIGTDGILASTEKLLAINRGLADVDERDSLKFQKVLRTHAMLSEGIRMDAGKIARSVMYQACKRGNLGGVGPGVFDGYVDRMLTGNQLTSPLEEINPMQLAENARRITKMGIGGLRSSQSITEEGQAVHPSQFGFIDCVAGPESEKAGIDVRCAWGTKIGSNGRIYQMMKNKHTGRMQWVCPEDLDGKVVRIPD